MIEKSGAFGQNTVQVPCIPFASKRRGIVALSCIGTLVYLLVGRYSGLRQSLQLEIPHPAKSQVIKDDAHFNWLNVSFHARHEPQRTMGAKKKTFVLVPRFNRQRISFTILASTTFSALVY
jgi:hypothetical protein